MDEIKITKEYFDKRASSWDERSKSNFSNLKEMILSTPLKEGDEVLDVACGTGIITGILESITHNLVVGIDLSSEMIKVAKNKYKDNQNIKFFTENFLTYKGTEKDMIFMFNAYPHFQDLEMLKEAIYKNLKNEGIFVIFSDLSLKQVRHHHRYCMHVSRDVISLKEDFKLFTDMFEILRLEEDDNHYLVIGKKIKNL